MDRLLIYCCLAGIGMGGLLVWLLPGTQAGAIGFCLIGFFLGPLFPSTIDVVARLVPVHLVPSAIGFLIGISVVGGAFFPWLVGTLAQYRWFWTLLPCILALTVLLCATWWAMTRRMGAPPS